MFTFRLFSFFLMIWSVQISDVVTQFATNTGQHMVYLLCSTGSNL